MTTEKKGQTDKSQKDSTEVTDEDLRKFFKEELANIPSPEEPPLEEPKDTTELKEDKKDTTPPAPEGTPKEKEPTEDVTAKFMEKVPEQFRSEDFAATLTKITDEWGDMQSRLSKRDKEVERLNKALQAQQRAATAQKRVPVAQPQPQPQYDPGYYQEPPRPDPIEEPEAYQKWMDERYAYMGQGMLTEFANNLQKVWEANSTAQFAEYDKRRQQVDEFNSFRRSHEDFDDYREDMVRVVEEHPYLNEQPGAVATVYEMAKERNTQKLGKLREGVKPEGYDDLKKAIVVIGREIQKMNTRAADERNKAAKEAASGTGGSTGTVRTKDRLSPETKKELDEDEQFWNSIVGATLGGEQNEGEANAADLLNLERFAKPLIRVKGDL